MAKILTIDLGTTYFKFTLFDRAGRLCDTQRLELPLCETQPGRMELPADAFWQAIDQGIAQLRDRQNGGLADVEAVGFATQTNSFLLLDGHSRPLTPIILWPDLRAAELAEEMRSRCAIPGFTATTGIPAVNPQFMLAKVLWLRQHRPEISSQTDRICPISDYLTHRLTGQYVTEAGAAALTGLIDIHQCRWWPDMLARFELDESRLSNVVRAGTDLGPITAEAARHLRLPAACRFVVGCLDQYAGAIGVGNVEPGMISETTGTVLSTVQCADHFLGQASPAVFQGPAFRPGLYWRMAFGEVSANLLHWYRDQLPDRPDFEQLTALAAAIAPGAEGLRLSTERGLAQPADVWQGMTSRHTRGHAVRSILEAVAFALKDQIAALSDAALPAEIRCAGGAARNDLWLQIKADVLGAATVATECPEPTSLGAAMLAEAALSGDDVREVARRWVRMKPAHRPDQKQRQLYEALRAGVQKHE